MPGTLRMASRLAMQAAVSTCVIAGGAKDVIMEIYKLQCTSSTAELARLGCTWKQEPPNAQQTRLNANKRLVVSGCQVGSEAGAVRRTAESSDQCCPSRGVRAQYAKAVS